MLQDQLKTMTAQELRAVIAEAKRLLQRKKLYIREITKPSAEGRNIYLYATWQENGKTRQKSLGRKPLTENASVETVDANVFQAYGIRDPKSVAFLQSMLDKGYFIAN